MVITRTPFRISFFGGGTDFRAYFSEYGGSVLSTTIDKYCYLSMRRLPPFFAYKNQLTYSRIERFDDPAEVQHPLVRAALRHIPTDRIQIAYDADLPACSGIGSSSAFAVGLLQGLRAFHGEYPDHTALAKEAIYLERTLCGESGGEQDQVAAAFGGLNRIDFTADGFAVHRLELMEERKTILQENLLLLFTGFTHFSGKVAAEQQNNIPSTLAQLHEMQRMTDTAQQILLDGDPDDFGRLLHETWQLKRTLSQQITTSKIDDIYAQARKNGALGGKVLGAGGGGFMLLYVPKAQQEKLKTALQMYQFVPFAFEETGTQLLYESGNGIACR